MGGEALVFMDDDDAGSFSISLRPCKIRTNLASFSRIMKVFGLQVLRQSLEQAQELLSLKPQDKGSTR